MKARKGIATKTLFELGMFVLAFIVIASFTTGTIPAGAESILRWLTGKGGETDLEFETTGLTEAIKCAYYRCKEGCSEAIAKTNPDYFVCEDYCKEEWQDEDGKICDDMAKVHPVELFFTGRKTVTDKFWDGLTGRAQNSLHKSDCIVGRSFSRSNDNLIFPKDSECSVRSAGRDGVIYDNCVLSTEADKLFLWSESTDTIICEEWPCEDGEIFCPRCFGNEINDFGQDQCIPDGEECEYECAGACGAECSDDAHCTALHLGDVCNLETCSCELAPPDYYCCYYGMGFEYVYCFSGPECEENGGIFRPLGAAPIPCDIESPDCPEWSP